MKKNITLLFIFTFALVACGQNTIAVADTPELAAKEKVIALQKLEVDTVKLLTCFEFKSRIDKNMIDNGYEGWDIGMQYGNQGDLSKLTFTTIFLNSDNDVAHVHITGDIRYPDGQVFTVDTIWYMEKNENIWQECGIVNQ